MDRPKPPVQLILDTDMGNDIDDALALAMIHALADRGECHLLAVTVSKDNAYAPAYVDLLNTFFQRGHTPIGLVRDGVTRDDGNFVRQVVELEHRVGRAAFRRTHPDFKPYPDAVELLRRQLADADDHSIVLLMIGFSTNMARLLETGADRHSPLGGRDLFGKKVKSVVMMAADFSDAVQQNPTPDNREYNIHRDIGSAQKFIADCPSPIVFSGFEIGSSIIYPASALATDYAWCPLHPVVEGYKRFHAMPYDRPTWDLTAVLFAVRPDHGYFNLSGRGVAEVDDGGIVRFQEKPTGNHQYLLVNEIQRQRIDEAQRLLAAAPPSARLSALPDITPYSNADRLPINGTAHRKPAHASSAFAAQLSSFKDQA